MSELDGTTRVFNQDVEIAGKLKGKNVEITSLKIGGVPMPAPASIQQLVENLTALGQIADNVANLRLLPVSGTIAIGEEAVGVINAAVALKNNDDTAIAAKSGIKFYFSSDSAGATPAASGTVLAVGTNGVLLKDGGDSLTAGTLISNATGLVDLNITGVAESTVYLHLIMPDGKVVSSGAITFAA
ncbi:MAG: hypothetical protein A2020_12095 [Lentisphaerae bacterium GWF2_45_14]|nr:MAG: hypothetical protein A2020_12095 [Lentisphaerae bacterium GWF2_45_14]